MKNKLNLIIGVALLMFSSCTLYHSYEVTGAPIGTKTGVSKSSAFGTGDFGIKAAAANGKITTIGAVETVTKSYVIVALTKTYVYGE